jgi:N-acetylglucosaminyldiphosphoundecaprenol N-acetyl-beta-D-mannosaminyltransferase
MIIDHLVETDYNVPVPVRAPLAFEHPREPDRVRLAGVPLDAISLDDAVQTIVEYAQNDGPAGYVVTPNAQHVVLHQSDPLLREIYEKAFLVATDGVPLIWAGRLLGSNLPGRVNGTDLFETLCAKAAQANLRVYFLGGRPGAATAAAARLLQRHPALQIAGVYCPKYGFEWDPIEQANILHEINACRPHLLFVGLGAPKQEYWMYNNRRLLNVPVMLGIGGSFEFVGGVLPRAPRWMQRAGLEWLFRLSREPGRLWKRYLVGNSKFCALIVRELFSNRRANVEPVIAGDGIGPV